MSALYSRTARSDENCTLALVTHCREHFVNTHRAATALLQKSPVDADEYAAIQVKFGADNRREHGLFGSVFDDAQGAGEHHNG